MPTGVDMVPGLLWCLWDAAVAWTCPLFTKKLDQEPLQSPRMELSSRIVLKVMHFASIISFD